MVDTLNFIDIWIKVLEDKYNARRVAYITTMKEMFNKIPRTMIKALNPKQTFQKRMIDIGGGCYMLNIAKGIPPLKISKLIKKSQDKEDKISENLY